MSQVVMKECMKMNRQAERKQIPNTSVTLFYQSKFLTRGFLYEEVLNRFSDLLLYFTLEPEVKALVVLNAQCWQLMTVMTRTVLHHCGQEPELSVWAQACSLRSHATPTSAGGESAEGAWTTCCCGIAGITWFLSWGDRNNQESEGDCWGAVRSGPRDFSLPLAYCYN